MKIPGQSGKKKVRSESPERKINLPYELLLCGKTKINRIFVINELYLANKNVHRRYIFQKTVLLKKRM